MFIYFLLFALPVYSFMPRAHCGYKKMSIFTSSPKTENTINENVKDFSTTVTSTPKTIIDTPSEPESNITFRKIARNGKFVDQDGKGNVWSVDPIIKIDNTKQNNISLFLNIMTGVGICSTVIYMLSQILPDYDSF